MNGKGPPDEAPQRAYNSQFAATGKISNTYLVQTSFKDDTIRTWLYLYWQGSAPQPTHLGTLSKSEKNHLQEAANTASTTKPPPTTEPGTLVLASLGKGIENGVDILHGGVTAALLDEAMGRLIRYLHGMFPATAEMSVLYNRTLPTPSVVLARALERDEGRFVRMGGEGRGRALAEGRVTF
ncbi:thioesterase superfamily protein [Paraphaeosphaeria sporulosa]